VTSFRLPCTPETMHVGFFDQSLPAQPAQLGRRMAEFASLPGAEDVSEVIGQLYRLAVPNAPHQPGDIVRVHLIESQRVAARRPVHKPTFMALGPPHGFARRSRQVCPVPRHSSHRRPSNRSRHPEVHARGARVHSWRMSGGQPVARVDALALVASAQKALLAFSSENGEMAPPPTVSGRCDARQFFGSYVPVGSVQRSPVAPAFCAATRW
jgi:hypothetical protein